LDEAIITALGDDAIVMTHELGRVDTHEAGKTTGLDQVDGTVMLYGTNTNELAGTVAMAVDGTV
jgi:hypothetical protein